MGVRIVTDSTCDLPESVVEEYGITVVQCYVNLEGKSFLDGVDLTRQEFYQSLLKAGSPPTTAAPGIESFTKVYERLSEEGASEVLSVHISASLSNTVNVAHLAAGASRAVPVTVFDGGQITLGTGLMAAAAAEAASAGSSARDIIALLRDLRKRTHAFAALKTMEFLRKSGRVSCLVANLGALLDIRPLLEMHDGKISLDRARTWRGSMERLMKLVNELGTLARVAIVHADAVDDAQALERQLGARVPAGDSPIYGEVTPVIGAHVGPGAVGIVCVAAG